MEWFSTPEDLVGAVVGNYQIVAVLGEGGMGTVYVAEHVVIGRRAAIKVVLPELCARRDIIDRMFDEARAATAVRHPGIVEVYDVGRLDDGRAFLVMELLAGETLDARIRRHGVLPAEVVAHIGHQIANALGATHRAGIVHRDLKPENVFLVHDAEIAGGERIKLLDFGIAKLSEPLSATARTRTGLVMGTPTYMAPEQCRGVGPVDHRADLYALGCILFEMLAGRPPFVADGPGEVMAAHLQLPSPSLVELGIHAPAYMTQLIVSLLAKHPADRPQSAFDVIDRLVSGQSETVQSWRFPSFELDAPGVRRLTQTTIGRSAAEVIATPPSPRRRRWGTSAAAMTALGVAVSYWIHREATVASVGSPTRPSQAAIAPPRSSITAPHDAAVLDAVVPSLDAGTSSDLPIRDAGPAVSAEVPAGTPIRKSWSQTKSRPVVRPSDVDSTPTIVRRVERPDTTPTPPEVESPPPAVEAKHPPHIPDQRRIGSGALDPFDRSGGVR